MQHTHTSRLTVENDMRCSFGHKKEKKKYMTFGQGSVQGYQHGREEEKRGERLKDDRYPHIQRNRMITSRKWKNGKVKKLQHLLETREMQAKVRNITS